MKKNGAVFSFFLILFLFIFLASSFLSASQLRVTEEHPFLVNGEWISASELRVGDLLQTPDSKAVVIKNITDVVFSSNFSVYNLEANEYSNFVVSSEGVGVVVHNSGGLSTSSLPKSLSDLLNPKVNSDGTVTLHHYFFPDEIPPGQTKTVLEIIRESGAFKGSTGKCSLNPRKFLPEDWNCRPIWGSYLTPEYLDSSIVSGWIHGGAPRNFAESYPLVIYKSLIPHTPVPKLAYSTIASYEFKIPYEVYLKQKQSFLNTPGGSGAWTLIKLYGSQSVSSYLRVNAKGIPFDESKLKIFKTSDFGTSPLSKGLLDHLNSNERKLGAKTGIAIGLPIFFYELSSTNNNETKIP